MLLCGKNMKFIVFSFSNYNEELEYHTPGEILLH